MTWRLFQSVMQNIMRAGSMVSSLTCPLPVSLLPTCVMVVIVALYLHLMADGRPAYANFCPNFANAPPIPSTAISPVKRLPAANTPTAVPPLSFAHEEPLNPATVSSCEQSAGVSLLLPFDQNRLPSSAFGYLTSPATSIPVTLCVLQLSIDASRIASFVPPASNVAEAICVPSAVMRMS